MYKSPQFSSVTQSCLTLCNPLDCSTPGFPVHHQLPEPTQTHVHHVGDAIQPSHPPSSPSPPAFNLSQHQGLFQWVGSLHQVAKVLEFQFHISPSNEYSGLISFRMDWLDLLVVQGTLKSLLPLCWLMLKRLPCAGSKTLETWKLKVHLHCALPGRRLQMLKGIDLFFV